MNEQAENNCCSFCGCPVERMSQIAAICDKEPPAMVHAAEKLAAIEAVCREMLSNKSMRRLRPLARRILHIIDPDAVIDHGRKIFTRDYEREIRAQYEQGLTASKLALIYHASETVILDAIRAAGGTVRPGGPLPGKTAQRNERIVRLVREGVPIEDIATEYGLSPVTVDNIVWKTKCKGAGGKRDDD